MYFFFSEFTFSFFVFQMYIMFCLYVFFLPAIQRFNCVHSIVFLLGYTNIFFVFRFLFHALSFFRQNLPVTKRK